MSLIHSCFVIFSQVFTGDTAGEPLLSQFDIHELKMVKWWNASRFFADYEYYYDYATESPAEDTDLNFGDWLFELLDVTGNVLCSLALIKF